LNCVHRTSQVNEMEWDALEENHVTINIILVTSKCFYVTKASTSTQNCIEFDAL
jgi:hypothetical protein